MFGIFRVWPLLRKLKNSKEAFRRGEAAEKLGKLGHKIAVKPLIEVLRNDDESYIHKQVVEALQQLGDPRAVEPLQWALLSDSGRHAKTVAKALASLGDPAWQEIVTGNHLLGEEDDFYRLASCGDKRAFELLFMGLGHVDRRVRTYAAWALKKSGQPEWNEIIKGDENDFARLGTSGDKRFVVPLVKALESPDHRSEGKLDHIIVVKALGRLGDIRAVEPLIATLQKALRDDDTSLVGKIVEMLGELGDIRAIDPIKRVLKNKFEYARNSARVALAKLTGTSTVTKKKNQKKGKTRPKQGIGSDCPYYSQGACVSGSQSTGPCTLEKGSYRTSCHVYPILQSRG